MYARLRPTHESRRHRHFLQLCTYSRQHRPKIARPANRSSPSADCGEETKLTARGTDVWQAVSSCRIKWHQYRLGLASVGSPSFRRDSILHASAKDARMHVTYKPLPRHTLSPWLLQSALSTSIYRAANSEAGVHPEFRFPAVCTISTPVDSHRTVLRQRGPREKKKKKTRRLEGLKLKSSTHQSSRRQTASATPRHNVRHLSTTTLFVTAQVLR